MKYRYFYYNILFNNVIFYVIIVVYKTILTIRDNDLQNKKIRHFKQDYFIYKDKKSIKQHS